MAPSRVVFDALTSLLQELPHERLHSSLVPDVVRLEQVVPVLAVEHAQGRVVSDVVFHVLGLLDGIPVFLVLSTDRNALGKNLLATGLSHLPHRTWQ